VQIPHVNIVSKLDLLNKEAKTKLERYLEPDLSTVLAEEMSDDEQLVSSFQKLNHTLATLVNFNSHCLVAFSLSLYPPLFRIVQCFNAVGWVTGRAFGL